MLVHIPMDCTSTCESIYTHIRKLRNKPNKNGHPKHNTFTQISFNYKNMNIDPRFQTYLAKADDTDAGEALDRLTEIYINACGVSLGERTTAFYASFYWMARFKETHPELPEDMDLKGMMELRSEEYRQNKANIDRYGISGPDPEEILRISTLMIEDYEDDLSRTAICCGTLFFLSFLSEKLLSN